MVGVINRNLWGPPPKKNNGSNVTQNQSRFCVAFPFWIDPKGRPYLEKTYKRRCPPAFPFSMANLLEFTPPPSSPAYTAEEWLNLASNVNYGINWAKEKYYDWKKAPEYRRQVQEQTKKIMAAKKIKGKGKVTKLLKYSKRRNTTKKNTWKIENSDERAQQEIGYGNYQARTLYTKRPRKGGRAAAWKKFKKRSDKKFSKQVQKVFNNKYPLQKTVINSALEPKALADQQGFHLTLVGSGALENSVNEHVERYSDLRNIFTQQSITTDTTNRENYIKKYLHNIDVNMHIANDDTITMEVQLYQMVCKKNMKNINMEGAKRSNDFADGTTPASITAWMKLKYDGETDASSTFDTATAETLGVRPSDLPFVRKYWKVERADRWELTPGGKINIDRKIKVKRTISLKQATENVCLNGVTRMYIFVVRGFPKRDSETVFHQASFCDKIAVSVVRTYNWKNLDDCYSRLTLAQLGEKERSISVAGITNNMYNTPITAATTY